MPTVEANVKDARNMKNMFFIMFTGTKVKENLQK